jgi:hypothetical protein
MSYSLGNYHILHNRHKNLTLIWGGVHLFLFLVILDLYYSLFYTTFYKFFKYNILGELKFIEQKKISALM